MKPSPLDGIPVRVRAGIKRLQRGYDLPLTSSPRQDYAPYSQGDRSMLHSSVLRNVLELKFAL